ncbi:glucosamine-6-phosphate isomerase [Cavenderia fasciculata]|uniref:Glucosamine-6-phosphate isomerase n=1 Tax=Cavenderia fasciculata TaxID=261658 RepID=F4QC05_CACFS|nr:glucosamine-6-phosphate isomerase [Cavenderia fasciculata]EGG14743.1 glucosamine-6-phosphate isomerase [Cavenderia fasciculata]|eukprot:XP_004351251.1 glucosamine-6-phosphate isomerase [Cavenderia fasciculata]
MRLIIKKDKNQAGEYIAKYLKDRIKGFVPTPTRPYLVLGLPTGSSPLPIYKLLVEYHKAGELSFKHVATFNMDEYLGLDKKHPFSYHYFMHENLFNHIDIDHRNVHILNGMASDATVECENYEKTIESYGGIDIFLGGMGVDGHIAFNEPGSSLASRTRLKSLTRETILVNSRFFDNVSQVPTQALTVGVGTILDAREVILIVTGHSKAMALYKTIEEGVSHMWTASALQMHKRAMIICDEEAIDELKIKTIDVKYNNNNFNVLHSLGVKSLRETPKSKVTVSKSFAFAQVPFAVLKDWRSTIKESFPHHHLNHHHLINHKYK